MVLIEDTQSELSTHPRLNENTFMILIFLAGSFVISLLLTGYLRQYALSKQLMDVPNHRSSHKTPTPRGGGLSFVLCFLMLIPILYASRLIPQTLALALIVCGGAIALLGFLDDKYQISAKKRLLGHISISALALYFSGGVPTLNIFSLELSSGLFLSIVAIFYLVWLLNLYNFMDGIDGIAGLEAISVCIGAVVIYCFDGYYNSIFLPLALVFPVVGFLFWNLPSAKIFMGDVGSSFLGFVLGVMSIHAASLDNRLFWGWIILLAVFIVDATVTLLYRAVTRQPLMQAHCNHAYQYASRKFKSHALVSCSVLMINIFWLLPWAVLITTGKVNTGGGLLIAYIPLIILALKFHAGKAEIFFPTQSGIDQS